MDMSPAVRFSPGMVSALEGLDLLKCGLLLYTQSTKSKCTPKRYINAFKPGWSIATAVLQAGRPSPGDGS